MRADAPGWGVDLRSTCLLARSDSLFDEFARSDGLFDEFARSDGLFDEFVWSDSFLGLRRWFPPGWVSTEDKT